MLREARSRSKSSSDDKEPQRKEDLKDGCRLKDYDDDGLNNRPTVSLVSSNGPIIHDVTDLDDENAVELDISNGTEEPDEILDTKDGIDEHTVIPDTLAAVEIPITSSSAGNGTTGIDESLEEELSTVQPDLETVAQLEAGTSNAGTVNSGALLSFEESRKGKEQETGRGKSVAKKQENTIAVTEGLRMDKEEFDSHLDSMQMDLEQLREVLSLQGNPLDASTLLGLFSADDQLSGSYFPIDMELFRNPTPGAITGNEVIAFNNSPFFEHSDEVHLLDQGAGEALLKAEPVDEKDSPDLFDLLNEPTSAVAATGPSAAKKKKRN